MTTYGYLYRTTLEASFDSIARAGYRLVEISAVGPHVPASAFEWAERRQLRRLLDERGLTCVAINPPELTLISPNRDVRDTALRQFRRCIGLAHDLEARLVVVPPGRRSPLIPMPSADANELALLQLSRLVTDAREYGVRLALEPVPYGFAESTQDLLALVRAIDDELVGVTLDVANIFGREDVQAAVSTTASVLMLAHVSDTWRDRWAHTSLGRGEVDLQEFLRALRREGFGGPCVYELVDGEDPDPRIGHDLETLKAWGCTA
jgi:sugar phosphate isomerase/epimerase